MIHSRFQDLIPAQISKEDDPELQRPDEDDIKEVRVLLDQLDLVTL